MAKRKPGRRVVPGGIRQTCKSIADAIGAHEITVQKWHYDGRLDYHILRFLINKFEGGLPK